ncbi:hypothetical protein TSAR_002793 [Trichomalopsis sarcophagae]|uniref:Uncharacterized protein n=1 Tax=Trichomalopsis sarcophagae TaxID=543379 RepID=A0A232F415_9HYME|nr:hypothetical protein TSAR_002793 [Trichomalopsis sarcophagae]
MRLGSNSKSTPPLAKDISQQSCSEMPEKFRYYSSQSPIQRTEDLIKYWNRMPDSALSKLALPHLTIITTSIMFATRAFARLIPVNGTLLEYVSLDIKLSVIGNSVPNNKN